jgi:hypothetical protein
MLPRKAIPVFLVAKPHRLSSCDAEYYAQLATEFGQGTTDGTNYLAYARREFRRCVLDQLRKMTTSEEEFRREAQALLGVKVT